MFTANSMNCLCEALGIALPGNGTIYAGEVLRLPTVGTIRAGQLLVVDGGFLASGVNQ